MNLSIECNHSAENPCVVINLKKTSCFSCLCCLRNVTRLLNLSSARQIWNDDAVKCERGVTATLSGEAARGERAHRVVVGESGRCLLGGGGGHALLFDSDAHRVPETCPHQLLQLLRLRGRKQASAPLLREVAQNGVQAEETSGIKKWKKKNCNSSKSLSWDSDCLSLLTWPRTPSPGVCRPHPEPARPDSGLHTPDPDHQTSS